MVCDAPERLGAFCPGRTTIGRTYANPISFRLIPRKYQPVRESILPYFSGRLSRDRPLRSQPRTAKQAVRAADVVVAAGGGYVTDAFRWHGTGVLGPLSLAQRLGKPTAMFGQGVGPIGQRLLRIQARAVLPKLAVLGLREGRIGRDLALSLGTSPGTVTVTGDEALELTADTSGPDSHLLTPQALITTAANCRAIVTGSYHAAVFGLAQGVPVVCLTKSSYYDAKFAGLSALFPGACFVGSLQQPDFADCLRNAIEQAWRLPVSGRAAAREAAAWQRRAYAQFWAAVESTPLMVTADNGGLVR